MHALTTKLIAGSAEQKINPQSTIVAGVYQPSFDILRERVLSLPETSPELDHLNRVYEVTQNQCASGLHDIRLSKNKGVGEPVLAEKGADLIAKSAVFTSIAINLPETHQNNLKIIYRLSRAIHEQEKTLNNPKLQQDLEQAINITLTETQSQPLSKEQISQLAQKGNETINKPKDNTGKLAVVALGLALLAKLAKDDEIEPPVSEEPEDEERSSPGHAGFANVAGMFGGFGKKEEAQIQPEATIPEPPTPPPTNIPFAGSLLKSFSSKIFRNIGKTLGSVFKKALDVGLTAATGGLSKVGQIALAIGRGLFSFFKGLSGGGSDPNSEAKSFQGASRLIGIGIAGSIILIGILAILDSILKSTALVDQSQQIMNRPSSPNQVSPDLSVSPSPAPNIDQSGIIPRGFPADSTCVTTLPGEGTHSKYKLNAIDLGNIAYFGATTMKATHPGVVIHVGWYSNYGFTVIIEALDARYLTYYGHMQDSAFDVKVGDRVDYETPLGRVDSSGYSTGNHVHYELRGPRPQSPYIVRGSQSGPFGDLGTILNYIPPKSQWRCRKTGA